MESDVDALAATVLAHVKVRAAPPIDVALVARRLGVSDLIVKPMLEDGRLERVRGHTQIFLREGVSETRHRFTVAHELGHLLLEAPEREFVAHRTWPGDDQTERFCDAFAAALLLPRAWMLAAAGGRDPDLTGLRAIATAADASLAATLVRLREVAHWRLSMLQWRRRDGRWALSSTSGVPLHLHNRVTSTQATRDCLDAVVGSRDVRTFLTLNVGGQPQPVLAELSRRGGTIIALATLDGLPV